MAKKQGYISKRHESEGMRLGKATSRKEMVKRDHMSAGLFGKRKWDWSNHQKG